MAWRPICLFRRRAIFIRGSIVNSHHMPPAAAFEDVPDDGARARTPSSAERRRPLVLHITGDYPDPVRAPTTEAVKRLIDRLDDLDHVVFSLVRSADPRRGYLERCPAPANQTLFAMGHFGLPFGVGLQAAFAGVARRIEATLSAHDLRPDIVHSHRLTFDGIAGHMLSREWRVPHVVSVRGEVETKVLAWKPTYRPLVRDILRAADRVLYVSAWMAPQLLALEPSVAAKSRLLPNIVGNVRSTIEPVTAEPRFVTAANLDIWRKKGIDRLIAALAQAGPRLDGIGLDIYGGGSDDSLATVRGLIETARLGDRVRLVGKVPNAEFLAALPRYLGLALPGRNETFGMVYTEALFAGVPILFGRATGIDGFLDGLDVGVGVEPGSVGAISEGLVTLAARNAELRSSIAACAAELHRRFDPAALLARYTRDVVALTSEDRHG